MSEWTLNLYPYAGIGPVLVAEGDEDECRQAASELLRRRRRGGYPVGTITPGRRWEIETPDDAGMISDREGILSLKPAPPVYNRYEEYEEDDHFDE